MAYELVHIFAPNGQELAGSPVVVQHKQRSAAFLASYFARNEKEVLGGESLSSKIQPFLPIPVLENTQNVAKVSDHKAPVAIIIPVYGQKHSLWPVLPLCKKQCRVWALRLLWSMMPHQRLS